MEFITSQHGTAPTHLLARRVVFCDLRLSTCAWHAIMTNLVVSTVTAWGGILAQDTKLLHGPRQRPPAGVLVLAGSPPPARSFPSGGLCDALPRRRKPCAQHAAGKNACRTSSPRRIPPIAAHRLDLDRLFISLICRERGASAGPIPTCRGKCNPVCCGPMQEVQNIPGPHGYA